MTKNLPSVSVIRSTERFIAERKHLPKNDLTVFSFLFVGTLENHIFAYTFCLGHVTSSSRRSSSNVLWPFKWLVSSSERFIIWVGQVRIMNGSLSDLNFRVLIRVNNLSLYLFPTGNGGAGKM